MDRGSQSQGFRSMSYPRKRAVTACESCRVRKTKCDNERPRCASCVKNNLPCSYDPRLDHSSFDPASLLILDKLNEVLLKVDNISNSVTSQTAQPRPQHNPVAEAVANAQRPRTHIETGVPATVAQRCSPESLEVQAPFASTDCLLTWPIFGGQWPDSLLSREILSGSFHFTESGNDWEARPVRHQGPGIREEHVPQLVERFLQFVHPKNPILYIEQIREHARRIAEDGFGWDATSCIVLLACALGAIALPFDPTDEAGQLHGRSSIEESSNRRQMAEAYFQAARKRIGLLDPGIMTSQCHMFTGIYFFYTLRPLQGWSAIHQAGSTLSLYLKARAALQSRVDSPHRTHDLAERHLEQRIYWTVLKSECEVRTELDLPQSDLCKLEYPCLFPSPPNPPSPVQIPENPLSASTPASTTTPGSQAFSMSSSSSHQNEEEQSWFYYLSEIALRRIENQILNTFHSADHSSWTQVDVQSLICAATSIEEQLETWHSSLPDPIRFDKIASGGDLDELRMVTIGRSVNMKALLYRPFVYIAVHSTQGASTNTRAAVERLASKAMDACLQFISGRTMTHRHHGTWYGLRESMSMSLMLMAASRGGLIPQISAHSDGVDQGNMYGRAVQICIEQHRYWEAESPPDIMRAREILEGLYRNGGW